MPEIVIAEFMDETAVEHMRQRHDTLYDATLVDRPDALAAALAEARVLVVRNRTQVRGALLAAAPRLEMVGRLGVGLDNIDLAACAARAIAVVPATGANDLSVAEYVITTAMTLLRGAYAASGAVAAGAWPRQTLIGRELSGRTIGLLGYGAIAREVAARARALGMAVVAHDPLLDAADPAWGTTRPMTLDALLVAADVVSLHVPLTEATRHMIGAAELARMKDDAILVNAARGGVIDETALAAALRAGRIGGAALDVFEAEPLTAEAGKKFVGLPNLILTPHIAGVTVESNIRVSAVIADAVLAHLEAR
ncbi:3-phosphoglycerate dehydrogenase [Nitratireductor sp. CAU 1489]|uniref:3-phosphoglycerate dehydrogenase n=1 Tax=Nitratireductor arenosus TaxID=2682096 RepID=A0A844QEA2_9HYPH|nr:NAD(P)-dependent oxidoreductase [Nitratireductor arenosus]MVA97337.1 3-phosphoglycerate dehydrogenase [Nitratireductor arenosus]